jgi:hypothetical protein
VVSWAQRLEHALGARAAAVTGTSRNGRGRYTGPDAPQWCNPPGRALGRLPTLHPGPAGIAAYLWIKDPGERRSVQPGPARGGVLAAVRAQPGPASAGCGPGRSPASAILGGIRAPMGDQVAGKSRCSESRRKLRRRTARSQ